MGDYLGHQFLWIVLLLAGEGRSGGTESAVCLKKLGHFLYVGIAT